MARKQQYREHVPNYCWVGESKKICYPNEEEALGAARMSEWNHGLPAYTLTAYKCDMGNHWHIAHANNNSKRKK